MEQPLEVVGAAGRDIEHGCDTAGLKPLEVRGVAAAAQVQVGQDLHRTALEEEGDTGETSALALSRAETSWAGYILEEL